MASDLLSIAKSGARAARIALDVTAQNIANASSEGYVRRTVQLEELAAAGGYGRIGDVSLSGVRLDKVVRNADAFRQAEVRRTGADFARSTAELAGLQNIEAAVEQSNLFASIVDFEGALQRLESDPVSNSLRAASIESARTMARTFNLAASGLEAVGENLRFEAGDGVDQVNLLSSELARVNLRLVRAADQSSDQTALLDRRDLLLEQLSEHVDVTTSFNPDHTVDVRLGGTSGPLLVTGGTSDTLAMTTAADGTISFDLGGTAISPVGGSLAGKAQALAKLVDVRTELDDLANSAIATINAAQAAGVDINGAAGQPMLTGTGAADIALAFEDGSLIATAPAGAGANSRDTGNLSAMRAALASADPAGRADALLFDISSTVAGRAVTRDALSSIAGSARIALQSQAGVDLDEEAVNLIRYQQAFEASGRVMQVASDLFDTLLGIR
jgi:flagellar hook-associated protein 1 FlgK